MMLPLIISLEGSQISGLIGQVDLKHDDLSGLGGLEKNFCPEFVTVYAKRCVCSLVADNSELCNSPFSSDEELRKKIYNGLEKNGAPINRRRETITNHYTRINTRNLLSRKDVESMLVEDKPLDFYQEKLFNNMSKYLNENLPEYDLALKRTL